MTYIVRHHDHLTYVYREDWRPLAILEGEDNLIDVLRRVHLAECEENLIIRDESDEWRLT